MRAGKLNRRVTVRRLTGDPPAAEIVATIWAGMTVPPEGGAPASGGLRSPAPVQWRMRYAGAQAGWYLADGTRLYHIDHVRNPDGKGADWLASCTELIGAAAVYTPAVGSPVATRCFVVPDAPFVDDHQQSLVYRARLELPLLEVGRAKKGDRVSVGGVTYAILGLVAGGDDGVVRVLWGTPT